MKFFVVFAVVLAVASAEPILGGLDTIIDPIVEIPAEVTQGLADAILELVPGDLGKLLIRVLIGISNVAKLNCLYVFDDRLNSCQYCYVIFFLLMLR